MKYHCDHCKREYKFAAATNHRFVLPIYFPTDRETVDAALGTVGLIPREQARLIRIPDTLNLAHMACSERFLAEVQERPELEITTDLYEMTFDEQGTLQ